MYCYFRLSGPERDPLRSTAREVVRAFRETPDTLAPYNSWGAPAYQVEVKIDPVAANLAGVTDPDVALTTRAMFTGAELATSYPLERPG